jgi:hypothetical protein
MRLLSIWAASVIIAGAFAFGVIGKVISPDATVRVLALVGVAQPVGYWLVALLVAVEAGLATALILGWHSPTLYGFCVGILVLFIAFLAVLASVDYTAQCACFGELVKGWTGGGPIEGIVRNLVFLAIIAWPTWSVFARSRKNRPTRRPGVPEDVAGSTGR